MVNTNPNFISTLSETPDSARITDGTDNIHSSIINSLNIASGGNRIIKGFDISQDNSGVYTKYIVRSNPINGKSLFLREGILEEMDDESHVTQTIHMTNSSDNTYIVLVIAVDNSLALREHILANKVAPLAADDIPIAIIQIAAESGANADDRKVQFLGYEQTNQGLSILDNNAETIRINKEGTITKGSGTLTLPSTTGTLALTSQLPTDASVRAHVEAASDSNVFTNTDHAKLNAIAAEANKYSLPTAAAGTLGGIKVGTNLSIDSNGILSAQNDDTQLATEVVQDIVGGMFSGNTETGINVTYQDSDGTIDLALTTTDVDVSVSNLETRLAQINTATTIGNGVAMTMGGNLTVTGDLVVSGNTTTLDVTNLAIEDNTILLNKNQTGNSTTDAGIEVERGNLTNVLMKWNETTNRWTFTNDGNNYFNIPVPSELANPYTHPSSVVTNIDTNGATIVDSIATDSTGHITAMGTRTLSLADLGYTGSADANTYTHPNHSGDVTSSADGATTIAANAVTTAKVANSAITSDKIASNAITNTKIDSNAAIAQSKVDGLVTALSGKEPSLTISDGLDRSSATLKLDISGLTNENAIDRTADFVAFHDNSVGLRKVNLANIFGKLTASDIPNLDASYRAVGTQIINADVSNTAAISADKIAEGTTNKLFTSTLESKLSGIAAGADANVQSDWNAGSGDAQILNKPTIPSGSQIIDWTANGAGTIDASNYTNTTYSVGDNGLSQKNFTTALYNKLVGVDANANNFALTNGSVSNDHLAGSISNSKLADIAQSKVTGLVTALNTKVENLGDLSITASATELNILDGVSGVSSTEIGYLDGVTSSIQTQLNSKLSSLALAGLTDISSFDASISNGASGSGIPSTLAVKTYVDGKATVDTTYSIDTADGQDTNGDNDPTFKTINLADNTSGSGSVVHLAVGAGLTLTRNAANNTITFDNVSSTVSKSTITPILASYDGTETVNIGDTDNDTTVNIRGNLNVLGTTTTVNQTQVNVQNAFVFEGTTANDYETTLTITDPTADRTVTLPDITGTLITSADTGTISNGMLASTSVSSAKIATNAVLTSKINASAVTTAKLASNAVTNAKLADDAVQTDSIANGAVTVAKITGLTDLGSGVVVSSGERTKLSGIETSADVTDATNVAAAGAVMDGDFSSNGFMKRTGAGSYAVDTNAYLTSLSVTGLSDINAFDTDLSSVSASDDSLASAKAIKAYVDTTAGGGSFDSFYLLDGVGTSINVTDGKYVQFTQGTGITATWTDTNSGASSDPFDITLTNTGVTSNVAGTGISVSGGTGAVTIANTDLGSAQNIFKTIAVSGQDNLVADSNSDTLNIAGGTNVTVTTTAGSDTLTISSTDTDTHLTQEQVEDYVGGLITAGNHITKNYNDGSGILTITGTANDDVSVPNLKTALNSDFDGDFTIGSQSDDTLTVSGSLTVGSDLIVSGNTITMNTSTLTVEDPLIALGSNNPADSVDLGFYGKYVDGSTIKYAGLFRDTSDSNKWKLFTDTGNTHAAPTTTVNTTSGFTLGTLVASTFEGGLVGNATTASTLATARTIAGVSFNGSADIAIPINNLTGTLSVANGGTGLTSIATLLNSNVSLAVADLSDIASLDTNISSVSSNDDTLASAKAIKTYVDAQFAGAGTGDMTGVDITAGDAISVTQNNTTSGNYTATIGVSGLAIGQFAGSALQLSSESFNNNDTSLMTSAAIEDKILSYGYGVGTGDGDITSVVAGTGLSGGATTGDATLNLDFSELTDMTGGISGSTELILQDGTTESRKAASEIALSNFNNDANWNNYSHPTGAGNNHIPTDGSAGQFLKYSASGTAAWATPSYTTEEQIEDFIAAMITAGTNITSTYDDTAGTLTLASTDTNTQLSTEQVQDIVGAMLVGTETRIAVGYDDTNGRINFVVDDMTNNTTYNQATSSDLGLVKIGYTENGKNYPVELSSGQMFVNVDWTDTNTNLNLLDEDDMASNSATSAASQQSIKTYVDAEVADLVASAPTALDTLNELAVALQSNDSDITTITTALGNRLRIDVNSQGLSATQQGYALDNLGITASLAEINILASGLSAGDIPNLAASKITSGTFATARIPTLNQNTTGSAGSLSATLAVGSGGTGSTTAPMVGVITAANAGAARTVLGLGTASTLSGTGAVADANAGLVTGDVVYDYIEAQGFGTGAGDMTGVDITAGTGISISQSNTTSGNYTATITNSAPNVAFAVGDITGATALTSGLASTDELVLSDAGALKRMDISVLQSYMQSALTFTSDTQRSAGALLDLNGNALDVDLSELTDMTESWVAGEDEFVVLDNGVQKRKLSSELFGSNAFNSTAYLTTHPNISAAASVDNSGRTYIQDITLDSNGHITAITSATETVTDSGNTAYTVSIPASTTKLRLTGSDASTDDIEFDGGTAITVTRTNDSKFTITNDSPNVTTNLGITGTTGARTITSSDGTGAEIPVATTSVSGVMSTGIFDAVELNTAKVSNVTTNLSVSRDGTKLDVVSSDGTNAVLPLADSTNWGVMSDEMFTKLDGIEASATADQTASEITALLNDEASYSLGTSSAGTISVNNDMTIAGDLTVTGTTVTANVETTTVSNGVLFESNATGAHTDKETKLIGVTGLTGDVTITLPSADGTLARTADVAYSSAISAGNSGLVPSAGTSGHYLAHNGAFAQVAYSQVSGTPTIPSGNAIIDWTSASAGTIDDSNIPTLNQNTTGSAGSATTATHVAGGALGSIPYQTGSGATSLLAGNTVATKKFITQTGNGSISAAPSWGTLVAGDIPDLSGTYSTSDTVNMGDGFKIRDDDDDDVTVTENEFFKITAATGTAGTNLSGSGTTGDPYVMAITLPNDTIANTFRTVTVDTDGNGTADNTLTASENLMLKKGSNITLAEAGGVVTISSANTVYTHPTHDGDDIDIDTTALTGATVISDLDLNITTDTSGHVTDANASVATRTLTLANLGYTGETDATADQTASEITGLLDDVASYTLGTSGSGTITIANDLVVTGTTTTNNVETVSTSNGVIFEGSGNAATEITLKGGTVSGNDKTILLPNADGTVALTSQLHDAVTLANTNYLSISGQAITGGTVPITSGGTGSTSAPMVGLITAADVAAVKTILGYGNLAALNAVGASQITDNSVGAAELNVSGNGTSGYVLSSDADGSFTWAAQSATGIALTALSVGSEASASGDGGIAYNNSTGVFTYTPPLNITGNAATATLATTTTVTDNNTSTVFPVVFHDESNALLDDTGNFTYRPDIGEVRANFLTATFDANVSGSGKVTATQVAATTISASSSLSVPNLTSSSHLALSSGSDGVISLTPNGSGFVSISDSILTRRGTAVLTDAPDTGTVNEPNQTYGQEHGITKIQGSNTTFGTVTDGNSFNVVVLPTGSVVSSNCSFRGIRGTIHIDAGLTSNNFVMTQDFIANDRDGSGSYDFISYGVVYEGATDLPFYVEWDDVGSGDMPLKITNNMGTSTTNSLRVWWDLTLFPEV